MLSANTVETTVLVFETDPIVLSDIVAIVGDTIPGARIAAVATCDELADVIGGLSQVALAVLKASGTDLAQRLSDALTLSPGTQVVLLDASEPLCAATDRSWVNLEKPFTQQQLVAALNSLWPKAG